MTSNFLLPEVAQSGYARRLLLPENREVWDATHDVWNIQGLWKKGLFGASPIADRCVHLMRALRGSRETQLDSYLEFVGKRLTEREWQEIGYQARTLQSITKKFKGVEFEYEVALDVVMKHFLDETAEGFSREARAMVHAEQSYGGLWLFTRQAEDKKFGIDIVGRSGGRTHTAVSVKPASYAVGYYTNKKIWKNRHNEHQHHDLFREEQPQALILMWAEDEGGRWSATPCSSMGCAYCDGNTAYQAVPPLMI